jgi:serine protease Do
MKFNFNKTFIIPSIILVFISGTFFSYFLTSSTSTGTAENLKFDEQEATIRAIKKALPAVVSIIVYDKSASSYVDLSTGKQVSAGESIEKGSGTGFLISKDGLILTNKHVVEIANSATGDYRVILSSGKKYYAQLIGKDPINDLAVIKIFDKDLPYLELGDSDKLEIGTTVVAIGNVLGKYDNSVTKGIVSGLGRTIVGSDQSGKAESLDNVIQTDAEINLGNSGGPLVDLNGKVVGINVATDGEGESIGFSIPVNDAKPVIQSVREIGRIVRPRLGIRYVGLTPELAQTNNLPVSYGAWIIKDQSDAPAITPGSPAEKAGLKEGDIIIEVEGVKLEGKKTLLSMIQKRKSGQKVGLRIQRNDKIIVVIATLDEFR